MNKLKEYKWWIATGLIVLLLLDYSRVSLCKGTAIPVKCESYLAHYGIE